MQKFMLELLKNVEFTVSLTKVSAKGALPVVLLFVVVILSVLMG